MVQLLDPLLFEIRSDEQPIARAVERIRVGLSRVSVRQPGRSSPVAVERRSVCRDILVTGSLLIPVEVAGGQARQCSPCVPRLPAIMVDISNSGVGLQHDSSSLGTMHVFVCDTCVYDPVILLLERKWTRKEHGAVFGYRSGFSILGVADHNLADALWETG